MRRPHQVVLATAALAAIGCGIAHRCSSLHAAPHDQDDEPSALLRAGEDDPFYSVTLEDEEDHGIHVQARVSVNTMDRRLKFQWFARAEPGGRMSRSSTFESTSFFPTALAFSRTSPRTFYVAGRVRLRSVLEKWVIEEDFVVGSSTSARSGVARTKFQAPSITRAALALSAGVGEISDLSLRRHAGGEEVWLIDRSAGAVFSVDAASGAVTETLPASLAADYYSLSFGRHSVYGEVCVFSSTPPFVDLDGWDPEREPPRRAIYDQDLDGRFEGVFHPIPNDATASDHVLYSTGEWLPDL